jgi:hypothetical protein
MFNHQYDFNIEIPESLISKKKESSINEDLLEGKILIGLCGYGKSGKDTVAKKFIQDYGFHRVAFADNIKRQMNEHFREVVCKDINQRGEEEVEKMRSQGTLVDYQPLQLKDVDFFTEDLDLKRQLRPYIIWYGEKMREINGPYYWINKAFEIDAKGRSNIILSDVRRPAELDVFKDSKIIRDKIGNTFAFAGMFNHEPEQKMKSYASLLVYVNQLGLTDNDELTHETIKIARENWMFAGTFYINPQLPEDGNYRNKAIKTQVTRFCNTFEIKKPDIDIEKYTQTRIFDN